MTMFWQSTINSEIDALLAREDVTLHELMDCEDIINQCKVQNKTLLDFLLKPPMMEELVDLITREPPADIDERIRFRYPNMACELLTSDVPSINERLASDEVLLNKLYAFLECEPPLNPLLGSYFSRILGALIAKKTEQNWLSYQFTCLQVLDFLKAKDTFISLLLKHLGTSAIMDLTLKLMTQVESSEMKQNILNWLDSQQIVQSLVSLLRSGIDQERHYNVAQLLCDFIRVARDTQKNSTERVDPDPLLNTLESSDTTALLLGHMFDGGKSESAIVGGIQVLLALLDITPLSIADVYSSSINDAAIDIEHKGRVTLSVTESIRAHINNFHDLLLNPPKKPAIQTTVGMLDTPLGNTRLQVVRLLAALVSTNDQKLLDEIVLLDTFSVLLGLFFQYSWNNFLHAQVENCLIAALKTHEEVDENKNALSRHLLVKCNLVDRILSAWKDNDVQQKEANGVRQGYMGHLISLTNQIVELCANTPIGKYLNESLPAVAKSLDEFKEGTLKETNAIQDSLLGGVYPKPSNEENDEYGDVSYPQDQVFSNYQMQHLTANSIDGYTGFNDDAFNDGDDTLPTIDHRTDMNFGLSDSDLAQQHELFKQVCAQNINTLDDADDQIFEERDHTFQTVIEKDEQTETVGGDDSDDEAAPSSVPMDVDPWTSPKVSPAAADPWTAEPPSSAADLNMGDWADFSSFEPAPDDNATGELFSDKIGASSGAVVNENDLKVENIEIEPKSGASDVTVERPTQTEGRGESKSDKVAEPSSNDPSEGDQCSIKPQDPPLVEGKHV